MQAQTSPVTILAYGQYGRPDDTDPPRWRSGHPVEFVTVMDPDDPGSPRQITLHESINGDRLPELTTAILTCTVTRSVVDGCYRQDGKPKTVVRDKWQVTAMAKVSAPAAAKAA